MLKLYEEKNNLNLFKRKMNLDLIPIIVGSILSLVLLWGIFISIKLMINEVKKEYKE